MDEMELGSVGISPSEKPSPTSRQLGCEPSGGEWQPIATAPKSDEDDQPFILVLQDGRRFLAQWDPAAGQWQGAHAFDGVEREQYFQEWPGRLYGVTHWMPLPAPPEDASQHLSTVGEARTGEASQRPNQ